MAKTISRINVWNKRYKNSVSKKQEVLEKEEADVVAKLREEAKVGLVDKDLKSVSK